VARRIPPTGEKNDEVRAAKIEERCAAKRECDLEGNRVEFQVNRWEIVPRLKDVSLTCLAEASGLSVQYCGFTRRDSGAIFEALARIRH